MLAISIMESVSQKPTPSFGNYDSSKMTLRQATLADLPYITQLFYETIAAINQADYTPEQIVAWQAGANNAEGWAMRIQQQYFLVAEAQHAILGFGSVNPSGYIDVLYVHKDYQGQGIASQLLTALENQAYCLGLNLLFANVSLTAQPFFERHRFHTLYRQTVEVRGIAMDNYRMEKRL